MIYSNLLSDLSKPFIFLEVNLMAANPVYLRERSTFKKITFWPAAPLKVLLTLSYYQVISYMSFLFYNNIEWPLRVVFLRCYGIMCNRNIQLHLISEFYQLWLWLGFFRSHSNVFFPPISTVCLSLWLCWLGFIKFPVIFKLAKIPLLTSCNVPQM